MPTTNHRTQDTTDLRVYKAYRMVERMRNDFTDARQQRIDAGDTAGAHLLTASLRDCDRIEAWLDDEARELDRTPESADTTTIDLYAAAYDAAHETGVWR